MHVKHILGMTGVAAQSTISDDYFKSKRAAVLNALKCKTVLIFAKAASMRINADLEPAHLAPPLCRASFCVSPIVYVCWCS